MRKSILGVLALLGIVTILISIAWVWIPDFFQHDYEFTRGYVCFQIIVGGFAFGVLWQRKDWHTHTNTVASILTVIGVFGTFLGIFIGLQAFKIENIEASISDLLEGLKLAFLTSLVGIGSAILLKGVAAPLFQTFQKGGNPIEVERDKFIDAIKRIETSGEMNLRAELVRLNDTIEKESSKTREVLDNIKTSLTGKHDELIQSQAEEHRETREMLTGMKTEIVGIKGALTGENESTVFAQLQELTSTVSEKVGEIAAKVGEIATGQLIEALREVIRDFNKNLTEQFGENFKQLNEAVDKTVEWQEQYRQQMDELANEFRMAAESIEQSRESVKQIAEASGEIAESSCSIVTCVEDMEPLLHTLNDQLEAFSGLRQKAHDAFPLIETRLNDLTTGFSDTVQTAIANSHTSMETQRASLATQADLLQTSTNETNQRVTELTKHFSDTIEVSIAKSQASLDQQRGALTTQLQQMQTAMIASNQKIQQIVDDVGERLDNVFERSANHITQVTTGFTQNLTQQLQNILENQARELSNIVERNKEDVENHVNVLHSALRKEVNTLNESLERELTTSLQTLGGHFESLSNGFVNNYTQLVAPYTQVITELQQLVNASRQGLR